MNQTPQNNNRSNQIDYPVDMTSWPTPQLGDRRASLEQKIHILDYYHALSFLQRRIVSIFRPYVKISTTSFCEWVKNESELRNRYHRGSSAVMKCNVETQAEHNRIVDSRHSPIENLSSCVSNTTETGISHYSPSPIPNDQPQPIDVFPTGTLAQMRSSSEPQASLHYQPDNLMPVKGVLQQCLDHSYLTGLAPLSFGLDFGPREQFYHTTSCVLGLSMEDSTIGTCPQYFSFDQISVGPAVQNDAAFDFESFICGKTSMDDTHVALDHNADFQYRPDADCRYTTSAPASTYNEFPTRNTYGDALKDINHRQNIQYAQYSIGSI